MSARPGDHAETLRYRGRMVATECPRCHSVVPLHEGRPVVGGQGIELWHPICYERRDIPVVRADPTLVIAPVEAPRMQRAHVAMGSVVGTALLVFAVAQVRWVAHVAAEATVPAVTVSLGEAVSETMWMTAREVTPPAPIRLASELAAEHPIKEIDGRPLDEKFPSLQHWIHPVSASHELLPKLKARLFGVERKGVERAECGEGHCGIDLDGPRGRPLVAVADGTIVKIERRARGGDGKSGKFVKIRHDDEVFTSYMHMDDIADGLVVGQRIEAGGYIGTLGATAVYSAPPHLHFSLEIPRKLGQDGDHSNTYYVDPAPFLARATIVPVPDRRQRDPIKAF